MDLTEANYVISQELDYNLRDNVYIYQDKLYKIRDTRPGYADEHDALKYRIELISLDGEEHLVSDVRVTQQNLNECDDVDDIAKIILTALENSGVALVSDEVVNTEAFRTLYL
jgi:hypothetical protein